MSAKRRFVAGAVLGLVMLGLRAQAGAFLPSIPKGDIALTLVPTATGLGAPDYAISPPGDPNRLFVVEQSGLLRIIQNGTLLPGSALDISARVQPPLVASNANDERGFLGLAFHPDFNTPGTLGFHTLYTYNSELIPTGTNPTYLAPRRAIAVRGVRRD
jgi:hypothetical protein